MEQDGNRSGTKQPRWYQTGWGRGLIAVVGLAAVAALWTFLRWYIAPEEPPHRKDLVLAWAAIVAGVAGIGTLYVGWRNMRTTQDNLRIAQENTERTLRNTREVEEERAREQALQSYLENIGELLSEEKLRYAQAGEARGEQMAQGPRIVARAQTLAVLQGLDPKRKCILLQFLYEAGLIFGNRPNEAESIPRTPPIVELDGAHLREADLSAANLRRADLTEAELRGADMEGAKGKSKDELEDQSSSLEGATMPDGSKHP